jgi:phosphoribosylformimino-5-aminoimidazole carboxamide ribotide isomerase
MVELGVRTLVHTDIERDGMMMGPNLALSAELAAACGARVIVSGGMRGMDDVAAVREAARAGGIAGAIVGKAIYEGAVEVGAAVAAMGGEQLTGREYDG